MKRRRSVLLFVLLLLLTAAAAGPPASAVTVLKAGGTADVLEGTAASCRVIPDGIVSVRTDGTVMALTCGRATVTFTLAGGKTKTVKIKVSHTFKKLATGEDSAGNCTALRRCRTCGTLQLKTGAVPAKKKALKGFRRQKTSAGLVRYANKGGTIPTEDQASKVILSQMCLYPHGSAYGEDRVYKWRAFEGYSYLRCTACVAFGAQISDAVFGDLPARYSTDVMSVKVGDLVRVFNDTHTLLVLAKDQKGLYFVEGNCAGTVYWGRHLTWEEYKKTAIRVTTRYPE